MNFAGGLFLLGQEIGSSISGPNYDPYVIACVLYEVTAFLIFDASLFFFFLR